MAIFLSKLSMSSTKPSLKSIDQPAKSTARLIIKKFGDFTPQELYRALALRFNVFVLEQQSFFPELDDHDFAATHLYFEIDQQIIAYTRAFLITPSKATFGRVVVSKQFRGQHWGRKIVERTIREIKKWPQVTEIEIEAQEYLKKFYASFGFEKISEPFDDGGVMHVTMRLYL